VVPSQADRLALYPNVNELQNAPLAAAAVAAVWMGKIVSHLYLYFPLIFLFLSLVWQFKHNFMTLYM
jgi:hypothetical protein